MDVLINAGYAWVARRFFGVGRCALCAVNETLWNDLVVGLGTIRGRDSTFRPCLDATRISAGLGID